MLGPTIEVKDQGIQDLLKKTQEKLGDLTPVMGTISETMHKAVQENFATEGARLPGGKWTELKKSTIEERSKTEVRIRDKTGQYQKYKRNTKDNKKGDYKTRNVKPSWPGKILEVSGHLLESINPDHDATTAIVGSTMPFGKGYAAIHNFGGKAGRGSGFMMPERPFLVLTDEDKEDIKQDIVDYLEK
jgi:phage gpG-like protein